MLRGIKYPLLVERKARRETGKGPGDEIADGPYLRRWVEITRLGA